MDTLTGTISDQIGSLALMMIGASTPDPAPHADGITFSIHITATASDGTRAAGPQFMTATITLDINDTYTVDITRPGDTGPETYFHASEIYAHQLETLFLRLERGTLTGGHHGPRPL